MPEALLASDSLNRLRPQQLSRSQFLTKTPMGSQEVQAIDIGLLQTQTEKARQDQALILRQKEIENAKVLAEKQMSLQKKMAQKQLWTNLPIIGNIIGAAK